MTINEKDKAKLEEMIEKLEKIKGRHTELVTVYIPAGFNINQVGKQLDAEKSTAANIKSKSTRKAVMDSLEMMIRELKLYKKTPENGMAIFVGNVSEKDGQPDIQSFVLEPPQPLNTRLYRCDQTFVLEPLKEMLEVEEVYGLLVMDRKEATFGLLEGKRIKVLRKMTSGVPGKMRAGGQCHVPGTMIQLDDGRIMGIENLQKKIQVKSIKNLKKGDYSLTFSDVNAKWKTKKQKIIKITTFYPQLIVESSEDHTFFVFSNDKIIEKPAGELEKNDILLMPERINITGIKHKLDSKLFYNSFMITKEGRDLIKKKRIQMGFFQSSLAKKMNSVQTLVSYYEIGRQNAKREFLFRLCEVLKINFSEFVNKYTIPLHYRGTEVILPSILDKTFSQFLGYFLGDGSMETDRLTFFEQRKEVALKYKQIYDNYFNIKSSYKFRLNKNYHQLRFTSRPLVKLVKKEFPEIKKTLDSEIPEKILTSSDEIVEGFIKGFFDAEGYVVRDSIGIASNNKKIIQQLLYLLLRFSILASLQEYDNKKNPYSDNPVYKLQINEKQSLLNFRKFIGFTSDYKSDRLDKLIKLKTDKSSVRQVLVNGKTIAKTIKNYGLSLRSFKKVSGFFQNKKMMSKNIFMKSILNKIDNADLYLKLIKYYDIPLLPVKIGRIEKRIEDCEMIDIETKNHNFLANGLIVHNSSQRFHRLTEGIAKEFFRKIAETMKELFFDMKKLKGILIGGPLPTKEDFLEEGQLVTQLKEKVLGTVDLGYADEHGLGLLVEGSQEILASQEIIREKKILEDFFDKLGKEPKKTFYKEEDVEKALKYGAVQKLLISKKFDKKKAQELSVKAEDISAEVEIISVETEEGEQFWNLGGVGAILRFEV